MPKLSFISDEALTKTVKHLLDIALEARTKADKKFERNVIDPFAVLFKMSGFRVDEPTWLASKKKPTSSENLAKPSWNLPPGHSGNDGWLARFGDRQCCGCRVH
ncbi:MAG: Eco47II family restriction endonuclease [Methylococcales bacterium]|nr:Eco47II family restriction endonuclease [Methylococcales bacterium]